MLQTPVAVVSGLVAGQVAWPVVVSRGQVTFTPVGVAEAEAEGVAEAEVVAEAEAEAEAEGVAEAEVLLKPRCC